MQYTGLNQHSRESNQITLESMKAALLILVQEKAYREISITELCKKAGVSRMAFYRNYKTIGDLLAAIADDLTQEVISVAGDPFSQSTGAEWYRKVFEMIRTQKDFFSIIYQENFQREWMKNVIDRVILNVTPENKQASMMQLIWAGGLVNAVAYWLNHNLEDSPEEMAQYCMLYLPHSSETASAASQSSVSGRV